MSGPVPSVEIPERNFHTWNPRKRESKENPRKKVIDGERHGTPAAQRLLTSREEIAVRRVSNAKSNAKPAEDHFLETIALQAGLPRLQSWFYVPQLDTSISVPLCLPL